MSTNIQLTIESRLPKNPEPGTTGFLLRERRTELGITSYKLADLSGVNRGAILKSELNQVYLQRDQLEKVCLVLKLEVDSILDMEHKCFYGGYRQIIDLIISIIGISSLVDSLKISRTSLWRWRTGIALPEFKKRRALIRLYEETKHKDVRPNSL